MEQEDTQELGGRNSHNPPGKDNVYFFRHGGCYPSCLCECGVRVLVVQQGRGGNNTGTQGGQNILHSFGTGGGKGADDDRNKCQVDSHMPRCGCCCCCCCCCKWSAPLLHTCGCLLPPIPAASERSKCDLLLLTERKACCFTALHRAPHRKREKCTNKAVPTALTHLTSCSAVVSIGCYAVYTSLTFPLLARFNFRPNLLP